MGNLWMFVISLILLQGAAWSASIALADYDCDASRGDYEKLELTGADGFQISGVVKPVNTSRKGSDWLPAAGALFQPESGRGGVGVQFWQNSRKTLTFGFRRLSPDPDTPVPLGTLPADQPISFALALDSQRRLMFRVNGKAFALPGVKVDAKRPVLMCSGGHFRFESLSVSTLTQSPSADVGKPTG